MKLKIGIINKIIKNNRNTANNNNPISIPNITHCPVINDWLFPTIDTTAVLP